MNATTKSASSGLLLGRALTQLLRAEVPSWPATPPAEAIVESGDHEAALLVAWHLTMPRRLRDADAQDAAQVLLSDGSSVSVTRAEALLADKEQGRVYLPLRHPLARAQRPFRRFLDQRTEFLQALTIDDDVIDDDDTKALADFVASTNDEMTICRELLSAVGGVELSNEDAVARGLDLPDPPLFNERQLSALVRQALPALPANAQALQRVAAPRACAGHSIIDTDALRLWTAPSLGASRFLACARGAGRLVAWAAHAPLHAPGLGLALVDVEARRGLDEPKGDAQRAFQVALATSLLLARAHAAVTLVALRRLGAEEAGEEARVSLRKAVGADGGADLAAALLLPPLPDGGPLLSPRRALLQQARAMVEMAGSWLTLRDAFDAGFLRRPRRLAALAELPASALQPALAWQRLLGEFF